MKKASWHKHHKWFGIVLSFFLIMFCLSGIVLNHPILFDSVNISRTHLPQTYRYEAWNNGLLRGTIAWNNKILIYGNNGIWLTDSTKKSIKNFNQGLPQGVDHRNIRAMCLTPSGKLFAVGQYGLYLLGANNVWHEINLNKSEGERLVDVTQKDGKLVVASRSNLFLATKPYHKFEKITLQPANNDDHKVSLFRTIWSLHSGELFGFVGKIVVDCIAIVLLLLTFTGLFYWFAPHLGKKYMRLAQHIFIPLHNKIGIWSIGFTLFLCLTGWFLRPPGLIAIASGRIAALPFTTMDNPNPWNDNLRGVRYDNEKGDWLLSTANGFYAMKSLSDQPIAEIHQPNVSVMGINVMEQRTNGEWLIGSFSGLYVWKRANGNIKDYFTNRKPAPIKGIPISEHAISGYAKDFETNNGAVDYYKGTKAIAMPNGMKALPMSLRNVCVEVHTGRIYTFLGMGTIFYISIMGLALAWCLWSGWKVRRRKRKSRKDKLHSLC